MKTVLLSWKAIANYFGTSVRTVQRWEQELGLPIRRVRRTPGSYVVAYQGELETWLRSRAVAKAGPQISAGKMESVIKGPRVHADSGTGAIEDSLCKILDTIPVQIWTGPSDGTLDFCNLRWRAELGLSLQELRGVGWRKMVHPEHQDRVWRAWSESVALGLPYEQEELHKLATGEFRWYLCRGVPFRNERGQIIRWFGCNIDIDPQKRAQDVRSSSEQLLRAIAGINDRLGSGSRDSNAVPGFYLPNRPILPQC